MPNESTPLVAQPANGTDQQSTWEKYVDLVEKRPLITKSVTATLIFALADLMAQGIEHLRGDAEDESTDWLRTARFAAFGLFGAPWSHYYFMWLDHYLPPSPTPWTRRTFLKVAIDQFLQAPILLAIMIGALSLMKGDGFEGVKHDLGVNFIDTLIANCTSPKPLAHSFRETVVAGVSHQLGLCQALVASTIRKCGLYGVDRNSEPNAERHELTGCHATE